MPIAIACNCGKRLRVADEMKGKKIRCPGCKAVLTAETATVPSPAVTKKANGSAARPAAKAPSASPADTESPKPKKSSAKVCLFVGCGCLGLVGSGFGAVVLILIVAVAGHKGPEDKLLGQWVLDKEATRKSDPGVLRSYKDIRYEFKKGGACTVQLNDKSSEETWKFAEEKNGELKFNLTLSAQGSSTFVFVKFQDDDHLEISYPLYCRLRRAGAGEEIKGPTSPGGGEKPPPLLTGHKKMITGLAFSSDGKKLASSSLDQTACVWDVDSAAAKQTLRNLPGEARGVAFLPDGKTVVTGSGTFGTGGFVKSWNAESGQMKAVLHTQQNFVSVLAMSPDGKFLAWTDGTWVILWDVSATAVRATLKDLGGIARGLAFSRDSKKLAACESSGNVRVWDVGQPDAPSTATRLKEPLCLAWSPDGTLAVGSEDRRVTLWIPATKKNRRVLIGFPGDVRAVTFSPDGKVLAASSRDTLKCFDLTDYRELANWKSTSLKDNQIGSLTFSPDGKKLAVGSAEGSSGGIILLDVGVLLKSKS
ncbi:MAG TPA: WD40 repeat domain-containing protein [Gemmataceae bacterium]